MIVIIDNIPSGRKEMEKYKDLIGALLKKTEHDLNDTEKRVLQHLRNKEAISRNVHKEFTADLTFGQRLADRVAAFGGSWPFIGLFALFMLLWIGSNVVMLLFFKSKPFDPFPYILLNLFLSMLAAIQAPVIMMSQNRQEEKDRERAKKDYKINLKSELEIRELHEKIDHLIIHYQQDLLEIQKTQIDLLENILHNVKKE